jgi:hypothetical protein
MSSDAHLASPSLQTDGGKTFAEPTAIICGKVEGCEEVSISMPASR